ncbi:Leucine Rich Repeat [Seminavis robusta]|uniref:Leucine Rich Repeat n=1 Tax=Seminavis robusta TaxID=568900 RepID=A0A9N8HD49_9STRA|nr:Leucine Rich Repeat [Seminavis robusta]|eukprot:Sro409_g137190.1 Leucine Rich Repeat (575) ;mRNA; r:31588-33312
MRVVAERSAAARREEAESATSKSNNPEDVGTQAFKNPGDYYVSEKGDSINLMAIVAQRSVADDATPSMTADNNNTAPPDAAGNAVALHSGIEYDHQTGCPMTKHSLPPGSVTPGAYSGAPGANYQAVEPVRLDVLGAYDESGNGEQIQRRNVSFQLFSSNSYNPQPLRVSSTANTTSELTAEVRRSDISLNEEEEKSTFKTYAIVTAIGCMVVLVVAIIVLVVVLQPDDVSSLEEVDWELLLLSSLDTPTQLLIEQEPASIQAQAYNWVIQDPDFDEMPPWRHLQRFALATIYYSTQGPQWDQPHDWLSYNTSECHWRPPSPFSQQNGTRNPTAYVEEEDPDHCNLGGAFDMLHLDGIDNFGGSFPSEIKVLTGLKEIHITNIPSQLSLSDFTPPQLAALTKLTSLDFTASNLETSNIPTLIGTFSSLKSILLSTAQIAGTLPTEIGLLENLDTLDVSVNRLGWFLPTEWSQLTNLARLYLQSNNLIGELPKEWGNLSSLRDLDISDNQLTGNIPMEWEGMVFLTEFALYQNEDLVGETPDSFCEMQEEFHQKSDCEKVPCCRLGGIWCTCVGG